jgi:low affinity Fe/Cu permease
MKFNFHFGKKKASLKTIIILTLLVAALAGIFKIEEAKIWDIVYETILHFDPNNPLIPELQKDPGIIERKTERTVDKAIREYEDLTGDTGEVIITEPRFIEELGDSLLGGPMRLCAPWVDDCPKE